MKILLGFLQPRPHLAPAPCVLRSVENGSTPPHHLHAVIIWAAEDWAHWNFPARQAAWQGRISMALRMSDMSEKSGRRRRRGTIDIEASRMLLGFAQTGCIASKNSTTCCRFGAKGKGLSGANEPSGRVQRDSQSLARFDTTRPRCCPLAVTKTVSKPCK